jgi:hypothetical protein
MMIPDTFDRLATERLWPAPQAPKQPARRIVFGALTRAAAAFQEQLKAIRSPIERAAFYHKHFHEIR